MTNHSIIINFSFSLYKYSSWFMVTPGASWELLVGVLIRLFICIAVYVTLASRTPFPASHRMRICSPALMTVLTNSNTQSGRITMEQSSTECFAAAQRTVSVMKTSFVGADRLLYFTANPCNCPKKGTTRYNETFSRCHSNRLQDADHTGQCHVL